MISLQFEVTTFGNIVIILFFLGHMMAGSRLGPRTGGQRHRGGNEAQGHLIYYPSFCLAAFLTSLILTLLEISTDYFLWKVFTA